MKRVEIIANRSVQADLMEAFNRRGVVGRRTQLPVVHGVGGSGPRQGDHIWPEENFLLIVYCEDAEARAIAEAAAEVKKLFPDEGIRVFEVAADSLA